MAKTKSKTQVPKVNHALDAAKYMAHGTPLTIQDLPLNKGVKKPDIREYNLATGVVLKKLEKKAVPISKALQSFKIKTADDYERKVTQTKLLKTLKKEAEALEDTIRKPLKDADKATASLFKPFYESIALIERQVKQEMLEYDEIQSKKLSLLDAKFESSGMGVGTYTKKAAEATAHTGNTLRVRMVLEIFDAKHIPVKYLVPDERAIEAALKSGIEVPGCHLVEKKIAAI